MRPGPRLIRGSSWFVLALAFTALLSTPAGAADAPSGIRYSRGRIEIQLAPAAARAARWARAVAASRSVNPSLDAARPAPDVTLARLGLPAVDRAAGELRVSGFEPQFRNERPPDPDSRETDFTAFYIVHFSADISAERAAERFRLADGVLTAAPIAQLPVESVPNDSSFAAQWWLQNSLPHGEIHAQSAWDITTGDSTIVVGVLDTGVLPYHPDLGIGPANATSQIYTNAAEANGLSGVDDDLNGFIDDVHGWDFISIPSDGVMPGEDYADPDNDPNDMAGHGTAVAGVIAAHTNNGVGGAGTAWQARIMPLRIGWSAQGNSLGLVDMGAVSQALLYAARMRVNVVNCSFATLNQPSLVEATNAALRSGVVIVFAAGNGGQPHDIATLPNVIAVGATHHDDAVTGFSNRGDYVDLSAPGIDILTTFVQPTGSDSIGLRQPDYVAAIGTSFSSPMVAGAVVLMQAQRRAQGLPLATPPNAQLRLRETTEDISAENPGGTGYGTGRLDLTRLLTARPTSTAARTFAFTTGPGVVIPSPGATPRVAYVTTNRRFLVISGQSTDTLVNVALPAFPLTRLAGATTVVGGSGARRFVLFVSLANGRIAGFDEFGATLPGWPVVAGGTFVRAIGGPALGDLDGDGVLEVVCGIEDGSIGAWHVDGTVVEGFPVALDPSGLLQAVALADLDGDGGAEIFAITTNDDVHCLRGDGTQVVGWPVNLPATSSSPVIARFGAGTTPAIVVVCQDSVHALNPDGSRRFDFTIPDYNYIEQDPALGDLDGDGSDEIVIATREPSIVVIDSSGAMFPRTPWQLRGLPTSPPLVFPARPGEGDVLIREGMDLALIRPDSTRRREFPKPGSAGIASTLLDVDGDGAMEVLAGTGPDSLLYVYDAGESTAVARGLAWPTVRGDAMRTGSRDVSPPAPIRDLRVTAVTDTFVRLEWTVPSNQGADFQPMRFEVQVATDSLIENGNDPTFAIGGPSLAAGMPEFVEFRQTDTDVLHWFAMWAVDSMGNRSRISNVVSGVKRDSVPGGGPIALAPRINPSGVPVPFLWRAAPGTSGGRLELFDVVGRRVRRFDLVGTGGGLNWDGRDSHGMRVPAALYFARLSCGSLHTQTRVVLLP